MRGIETAKEPVAVLDIRFARRYRPYMSRSRRAAEGGLIDHGLNRANARLALFDSDADSDAFERVLQHAVTRFGMRLLGDCVMPNQLYLMLWPREDGDLSSFMRWLTMIHTQRWPAHRRTAGTGSLTRPRKQPNDGSCLLFRLSPFF